MISPIYKIQNRGQVVHNACQWLWEHRRLAFRIMVLPTLICAGAIAVNIIFIDFWPIYLLATIYALLFLPILPCLMFHVVENPDESGYPERMPRIKEVLSPWWRYFLQMLIVTIVSMIAMFIASFTLIGGFLIYFLVPLAIVVAQRDDDAGVGALVIAFKMIKNSFGNFCMVSLGSFIISMSMTFAPFMMVYGIVKFLQTFMTKTVAMTANSLFNGDFIEGIGIIAMLLGGVFSIQIITVIYHFFYGHCVEKESHPALIERMEEFDEK